jgi:ubiquinone/menaquinone biosynthesis C-methylase UbiE
MELLEWDAESYDVLPLPHKRWGPRTISRLRLAGDETVADIGCGTGRDAQHLLQLLPRGRVLAIDGSQQIEAYLDTVLFGVHLRELSPEDRAPFVRAVASRLAEPVVDYVRLQIRATRR